MKNHTKSASRARLYMGALWLLFVSNCFAQHLTSFSFTGLDGSDPRSGLVADTSGHFYGTTFSGGSNGLGLVYQISLSGYTVLYNFSGKNGDGANPIGNLVMDEAGNLYGVTELGGSSNCRSGCGTVFELSPPSQPGAPWTETILYAFQGFTASDGESPLAGLVFDSAGNLYGTTFYGGIPTGAGDGVGVAFELSPPSQPGGTWAKTILYEFGAFQGDAKEPAGTLIFDSLGNLYGTSFAGGKFNQGSGTVFELSPPLQPGAPWTESILYSAIQAQCSSILAGVVMGSSGALFGVCYAGGPNFAGSAFRLQPPSQRGGSWTFNLIHYFTGNGEGGPGAPMIFVNPSLLYGTDGGGLYQVALSGNTWTYSHVYPLDNPQAPVLLKGVALYGTTAGNECGTGCGTVFQLTH